MFFPVLEAMSKQQISASLLQLFLLLPAALGRVIAPLARLLYHRPPLKGQAPSLLSYPCFGAFYSCSWNSPSSHIPPLHLRAGTCSTHPTLFWDRISQTWERLGLDSSHASLLTFKQ